MANLHRLQCQKGTKMKKFAVVLGIVIAVALECGPGMAQEHGVPQYHGIRVAMNSALPRAERAPARPQYTGSDSRVGAGGINTSDYVNAHLMTIGQYRSDESAAGPADAKRNANG